MDNNTKPVIFFVTLITALNISHQIYVPNEDISQKPVTYTSGIKTSSYRKPFQIHHNYSRVYHQNYDNYIQHVHNDENDETSQRPYPVYNAHTYGARPQQFERLTQVYILNGTRIRKNENPTRQIVKFNKEKRSSKIEIYRNCPKNATGQYVYEFSCNQFLNCWKGRGYVQNCAPGTLFNPKTLECDFPEKVYCVSGPRQTILQKERKSEDIKQVGCPREFSGLIPNYTDCSKFINCVSGIENLMDCPPGTLFDVDKNICDFAYKANCFSGQNQKKIDGKLDFAQEKQQLRYRFNEVKCPDGATGLHKHPTDCSKFLNCASGQTYIQDCAPGTLFNPVIKICDFPYNVRCENSTIGTGVVDYDGGYHSQNKSLRDYSTNRNEWYTGNKYYGSSAGYNQDRYTPYDTDNNNSQNQKSSLFDRRQNHNENLLGYGHYNQQEQTQYNVGSDSRGFGHYSSSTQRYGDTSRDYRYGFTNGYSETDNSRPTYDGSTLQNNYEEGSRPTYGRDPILTRPSQNVNTWSGHGTHQYDLQNQYPENQNHKPVGRYDTTDVYKPGQNVNGYQRQGSNGFHYNNNNENGGYQQPYNIKGTSDGYHQNLYRGQWRPNTYSGHQDNKGTWGSNQYIKGSDSTYGQNYWTDDNRDSLYVRRQPEFGQAGTSWGSSRPTPVSNGQDHLPHGNGQNWGNNQHQFETIGYTKKKPFSTQHPESDSFDQRGETGYNRWNTYQNGPNFQNQNNLDMDEVTTTNYDEVVNINQVRKTTPFRNSYEPFFGPTTPKPVIISPVSQPIAYDNSFISGHSNKYVGATTPSTWRLRVTPVSQTNDYDDTFVPDHSSKFVRATTPQTFEKNWPPPFPSTDVNADYVFEYDDNDEITLEAENSFKHDNCGKNDFHCSNDKCISKSFVCNSFKDCPNGEDELNCLQYVSKFSVQKNKKLAILEKERWNNVSIATCALLCVESQKFKCRSFNYRKIDKTCFLTNTNEGLTGAMISYYPFDYYELNSEKLNCSEMYLCENNKCIDRRKICDGIDDCGDRMDEKGCKPQDCGYSIKLSGSTNKNEGYIEVTAFGKTGFVCDDHFGLRDASVVCKELGFPLGAAEVKGNSFFAKNLTTNKPFYMMDDVACTGNETTLMDCDFSGWGVHNCLEQEIVGVVCKTPVEKCATDYWQCDTGQECLPLAFVCDGLLDCTDGSDEGSQHCDAPTQIRLVNGSTRQEGRVEIRHHGIWGTICDDDFNEDAAKVICRQLGYKGSAVVKKDASFGSGSGPIWLDQVFCSGNETSIEDCSHWNWGEHNCEHSEDVGVVCSNTYEYEERHQSVGSLVTPRRYPDRCGYRNDNIFDQEDDVHARVVKGSIAKKGDYPWQAAIRVKGKSTTTHWCGAVIISEKFVLTAAHCLIGYPKGAYVVVAGDYNVDEPEGTEQESYIEDYYLHENFRQGHKMNNDIGLVKLKGQGFRLGGDVQAICLPDVNTNYETDQNCTISGFGSIETGRSAFSHNLRAGWVPLQKREICTMPHVYGNILTDGMFCAGSLDEGVDACDGDSGGPLACLDNGVFTLYGITSWGQHCGYANKPGVYVKVAHYKKWIDDNFKKYSGN